MASPQLIQHQQTPLTQFSQLQKLGFSTAATLLDKQCEACEQWALAYAHFPFVTNEQIILFKQACIMEEKRDIHGRTWCKELKVIPISQYAGIPPAIVLDKLQEAQALGIFKDFEVAYITWKEKLSDPILFGRVDGCPDYFLIAQWGEDVKFSDIAK